MVTEALEATFRFFPLNYWYLREPLAPNYYPPENGGNKATSGPSINVDPETIS